jgi:hypothetical protein
VRAMRDGFTSLTRTEITRVEKKHIRGFGDPKV